jgi:hypothetical protein
MNRIWCWVCEWSYRGMQVGECEGIGLVEAGQHDAEFVSTIVAAMKLIETIDPRRFALVKQRIKWIANASLFRTGGNYQHATKLCVIDFSDAVCELDRKLAVGWCAKLLVHEATHGVISGRGIPYSRKVRFRVERRCVQEEQRFVARLTESEPELARWLYREFDEADWAPSWNATLTEKLQWLWSQIMDTFKRAWAEAGGVAETVAGGPNQRK